MTNQGNPLSFDELRAAAVARQAEWCPEQIPDLSFRGNELAGEVGEACNVIKKLERERLGWRGSRDTVEHLADELADVVICADLVALSAGIDLGAAVARKFNETSVKNGLSVRLAPGEPTLAICGPEPQGKKDFPHPTRKDGEEPCGECHIPQGEKCDICGAAPKVSTPGGPTVIIGRDSARSMDHAPRDRPILAYCDHEADLFEAGTTPDGRSKLTLYAAHAEGLGHAPTGFHIIEWGGGWSDGSEDGGSWMPDWWFVAGSEFEVPANPLMWWPLPDVPAPDGSGADERR